MIALWVALPVLAAPPAAPPRPQPPRKSEAQASGVCPEPTGGVVAPDQILRDLMDGKDVVLQGKIIDGSLDAESPWPAAGFDKSSLRIIRGQLKLNACRVNGHISLPRVVVLGDITLTCTEVQGDVDLSDSEVRGTLTADRARLMADLRLTNTTFERDLSMRSASVGGRVDLSGSRLHRVILKSLDLRGGMELEHAIVQMLELTSAKIAGTLKMSDILVIDALTARDASFAGGLMLDRMNVAGPMDMSWSTVTTQTSITNVSVSGDLFLPRYLDGPTELSDVTVGKNLVLENGEVGDAKIERLKVRGSSKMTGGRFTGKLFVGDTDFGKSFTAKDSVFSGECKFLRVRFPGADPLANAVFARTPTLMETKLPHDPVVRPDVKVDEETEDSTDQGTP